MDWTVDWTVVGFIGLAVLALLLVVGGVAHALIDRAREGTLWVFDLVLAGTGGVALLACAVALGADIAERTGDQGASLDASAVPTTIGLAPTETSLSPLVTSGPTTTLPPVDPSATTVAAAGPVPTTAAPVATVATTTPPIPLTIAVATTPLPTPVPTPPPTTAPARPPVAGEPLSSDVPCDGHWVVFLGSTNGRVMSPDAFLTSVQQLRDDSTLVLVDTDRCASMSPGLWGVVVPTIYASSGDAIGECHRRGLNEAVACMAVPLTNDAADRNQRAFP